MRCRATASHKTGAVQDCAVAAETDIVLRSSEPGVCCASAARCCGVSGPADGEDRSVVEQANEQGGLVNGGTTHTLDHDVQQYIRALFGGRMRRDESRSGGVGVERGPWSGVAMRRGGSWLC